MDFRGFNQSNQVLTRGQLSAFNKKQTDWKIQSIWKFTKHTSKHIKDERKNIMKNYEYLKLGKSENILHQYLYNEIYGKFYREFYTF